MQLFRSKNFRFLLLITLIVGIAYGICIPKLSFYGDDWIYIYNYHIAGEKSFTLFTQWDRPYSAWIYILTSAAFGESPLGYHIYVLVMRWLAVFLFWRILTAAFGDNKTTAAAALLFAVYPGFQQQPIAVEYVMHFTSLTLVLLSIRLMQAAFFLPEFTKILLVLISIGCEITAIFTCEYFTGLELTRPLFLYFTIRNRSAGETRRDIRRGAVFLIPYVIACAFFFVWRIFIFSFQTYQPKLLDALREDTFRGLVTLAKKAAGDLWTVFFKAYRLIFSRPSLQHKTLFISVPLVFIAVLIYFLQHKKDTEKADRPSAGAGMLLLGVVLTVLSGIPFWGTFLDVSVSFPWDRSTLSFSPGAAIVIAAIMDLALRSGAFYTAAVIITALSVLFHIQNGMIYINEAEKMNDYFWQLAWRAPGLEKGTILVSDEIPLDRYSDNDISPIINWQYAPDNRGLSYDYKYFDLDLREEVYYADLNETVPVDHTYRTHSFSSNTEKTLGLFYKKAGCLQIISPQTRSYPDLPDSLARIAEISDTDLILSNSVSSAVPPLSIGPEPEHGYCYYYQKTALAQQFGDSVTAYSYASEVLNSDLRPVYAPDLAPVVLALIKISEYSGADELISRSEISSSDREFLCSYWKYSIPSDPDNAKLTDFYKRHGCL